MSAGSIPLAGAGRSLEERFIDEVALQASFLRQDVNRYLEVGSSRTSVAINRVTKKSLARDRDRVRGMVGLVEHVLGHDGIPPNVRQVIGQSLAAAREVVGK